MKTAEKPGRCMALLNPPAPTVLEPKTTISDTTPRKEIAATAQLLSLAQQHPKSYTTRGDATVGLRGRRDRVRLGWRASRQGEVGASRALPCSNTLGGR